MSSKCKHWIDLRELPGVELKEQSYIRFRDIERVSFIETRDETSRHEYKIFVSALGEKYLYSVVKTEHEAMTLVRNLLDDIEYSATTRN
ncbi:MAG: hypothetical protein PHW13_08945 [Methylococcales bacterium]|nr:hypothetical protein [Methylococcales bacterium]